MYCAHFVRILVTKLDEYGGYVIESVHVALKLRQNKGKYLRISIILFPCV